MTSAPLDVGSAKDFAPTPCHYFESVLPKQFDEYIWLDQTSAVQPLERRDINALDEMHPLKT